MDSEIIKYGILNDNCLLKYLVKSPTGDIAGFNEEPVTGKKQKYHVAANLKTIQRLLKRVHALGYTNAEICEIIETKK